VDGLADIFDIGCFSGSWAVFPVTDPGYGLSTSCFFMRLLTDVDLQAWISPVQIKQKAMHG
jgi:hypothetical protein